MHRPTVRCLQGSLIFMIWKQIVIWITSTYNIRQKKLNSIDSNVIIWFILTYTLTPLPKISRNSFLCVYSLIIYLHIFVFELAASSHVSISLDCTNAKLCILNNFAFYAEIKFNHHNLQGVHTKQDKHLWLTLPLYLYLYSSYLWNSRLTK